MSFRIVSCLITVLNTILPVPIELRWTCVYTVNLPNALLFEVHSFVYFFEFKASNMYPFGPQQNDSEFRLEDSRSFSSRWCLGINTDWKGFPFFSGRHYKLHVSYCRWSSYVLRYRRTRCIFLLPQASYTPCKMLYFSLLLYFPALKPIKKLNFFN